MKALLIVTFTFTCNIVFGQALYTFGEKDFNEDAEENTVFTVFEEKNFPKLKEGVDLSNRMPPAGEQGTKGSCWAWATTYVLRSIMDTPRTFLTSGQLDKTMVFSPEYVYQYYKGNVEDCNWGATSKDILPLILRDGSVKLADFLYDEKKCNQQPSEALKRKARTFAKPGYSVEQVNSLHSIKKVLNDGQPLVISIRVDDFFATKGNITASSPFWKEYGTRVGSHAMVVVGYDDRIKALKVLNSWGKSFGKDGYVWIAYSIINSAMNYCCYPRLAEQELAIATPTSEETGGKSSSDESKPYSSWMKKGYYRTFDNLRIGIAGLDASKKFAFVHIRDLDGNLVTSFYIDNKTSKEFYVRKQHYTFTLDNIGSGGRNIFTKAAYFTVEKAQLRR